MFRLNKKLLLVITFCLLPGCNVKTYVDIYNNTNENLVIKFGEVKTIYPGDMYKFTMPYQDANYISIKWKGNEVKYLLPPIPDDYMESGIVSDLIKLQVDTDKQIYIAPKSENFPLLTKIQPNGFPLIEIKE